VGQASHVTVGALHTRQVGGLPGINYALTTGSPPGTGGSGGGPGSAPIGRLRSGTGGQGDKGPYQSAGPFIGNPPVNGTWAQDLDLIMGWRRLNVLGLNTQTTIGTTWNTTLSIPGWFDLFGTPFTFSILEDYPALKGIAAIAGQVNTIIGSNTLLHYGPSLVIDRGPKISSTVSNQGLEAKLPKLFASLYLLMAVTDTVLPLAQPGLKDAMGSAVGAAEVLGVGAAAVTGGLLAAWAEAEIAFSTSDVAKDAAERATKASLLAVLGPRFQGLDRRLDRLENGLNLVTAYARQQGMPAYGPGDSSSPSYNVCDSDYTISAPGITLVSNPAADSTGPSGIYLEALGSDTGGGDVLIFGSDSAFVAGGAMASINVFTNDAEEGTITADCGPDGTITLQSGLAKEPNALTMSPEGISVTSLLKIALQTAESSITIDPEQGITLQVAESSISITPEGITLSCGAASIEMTPAGLVLSAPTITVSGEAETTISTAALAITE
jgi:hypothetical protein